MRLPSTEANLVRCCFLAAAVLSGTPSPLDAQVAAGEITGSIQDQAGAAVPGATVTVTNEATNRQRTVMSTNGGVYTAPGLAPGAYRVDVTLAGFKPISRSAIRVATGETSRLDFELTIGEVRERVT